MEIGKYIHHFTYSKNMSLVTEILSTTLKSDSSVNLYKH